MARLGGQAAEPAQGEITPAEGFLPSRPGGPVAGAEQVGLAAEKPRDADVPEGGQDGHGVTHKIAERETSLHPRLERIKGGPGRGPEGGDVLRERLVERLIETIGAESLGSDWSSALAEPTEDDGTFTDADHDWLRSFVGDFRQLDPASSPNAGLRVELPQQSVAV
jgi:hypothetical protein